MAAQDAAPAVYPPDDRCIPASALIRRYIAEGLARDQAAGKSTQLISVDEAIRAATRALSELKHSA